MAAGNRAEAYDVARSLLSRDCSDVQRVRALLVLGKIDYYLGRASVGHGHFQVARGLASAARDAHLSCAVLGAQVDCLFHFESFESGVAHLSDFRRAAIRSGRPDDLFMLRTLLAEAELKAGRVQRAARELELAEVHQAALPNLAREAQLAFVSGVVSISLGQLNRALVQTQRAAALAEQAGAIDNRRTE